MGLNIIVNINANIIVAVIPVAVKENIPVNKLKSPSTFALASAPWINKCPKLVIHTIAPAPNLSTNKSYIENVKSSSFLIKIFSLSPITDVLGTII